MIAPNMTETLDALTRAFPHITWALSSQPTSSRHSSRDILITGTRGTITLSVVGDVYERWCAFADDLPWTEDKPSAVSAVRAFLARLEVTRDAATCLLATHEPPLPVAPSLDYQRALACAKYALALGDQHRATLTPDGRPETVTTHTVMLGLAALALAPPTLDRGALACFALVHDLPEAITGDTNSFGITSEQARGKDAAEIAASNTIALELPIIGQYLASYRAQTSPEARFIRFLDKILPKLTHVFNNGAALHALGHDLPTVIAEHARQLADLLATYPEFDGTPIHALFREAAHASHVALKVHTAPTEPPEPPESPEPTRVNVAVCCACGAYAAPNAGAFYTETYDHTGEQDTVCVACGGTDVRPLAAALRYLTSRLDTLEAANQESST